MNIIFYDKYLFRRLVRALLPKVTLAAQSLAERMNYLYLNTQKRILPALTDANLWIIPTVGKSCGLIFENSQPNCITLKPIKYMIQWLQSYTHVCDKGKIRIVNKLIDSYEDLPAVVSFNGDMHWCKSHQFHRIGKPACIYIDNQFNWYQYGELHRDNDLPAITCSNGQKEWYQHGQKHRVGGPAVIWPNGQLEWYQYGELHRDDGPAVEFSDGGKQWRQHGKLHRDNDLPAILYKNGKKMWYQHGKLHRDNDLPAIIFSDNQKEWHQHGELHRDNDLPAIIFSDGQKQWYHRGKLHRENGPAVERANGTTVWYRFDKKVD